MISRYSRKELTNIWSEENKYKIIPKGVSKIVKKKGRINVKRIHQIESKVKHDVIAFLTSITENGYEIFTESVKGYTKPPYN